jgi:hypothetical protein
MSKKAGFSTEQAPTKTDKEEDNRSRCGLPTGGEPFPDSHQDQDAKEKAKTDKWLIV